MWWGPLTNHKTPRAIDQSQLLHALWGAEGVWRGTEGQRGCGGAPRGHRGNAEGSGGAGRGPEGAQRGAEGHGGGTEGHEGGVEGCLSMVTIGCP